MANTKKLAKESLEDKAWFRFLKVIYILAFLFASATILFTAWSYKPYKVIDGSETKFGCVYGTDLLDKLHARKITSVSSYFDGYISNEQNQSEILNKLLGFCSSNYSPGGINFDGFKEKNQYSWALVLKIILIGFLCTIVLFEIVKKIFFYIVIGKKTE